MFATMRTLTVLAVLSGAVLVGCSENPATGEQQLSLISKQQEIAMGEEAAPQFEQEFGGPVPDSTLQNYVTTVGMRQARQCERQGMPWEFTLVRSKIPNAFALPGGKVFVTAGLMGLMNNERELAAVLAHEVSHVCARHNVQGLQRQMGTAVLVEIAAQVLGGGDLTRTAAKIATNMANLKYSRNDEYEADRLGIRYMEKANYNPWGMVELLNVLMSMHESEGSSLGEMFQTHPLSSNRIEQAEDIIQQGYPRYAGRPGPDPQAATFRQMQDRLFRIVPEVRPK